MVERYQGVGKAWGEPRPCASAAELEARLEELDRWQRELYPLRGGRPRREAYPGLQHSGRRYTAAWEARTWDLRRVWRLMESYVVPRRVDRQGKVSLYGRPLFRRGGVGAVERSGWGSTPKLGPGPSRTKTAMRSRDGPLGS